MYIQNIYNKKPNFDLNARRITKVQRAKKLMQTINRFYEAHQQTLTYTLTNICQHRNYEKKTLKKQQLDKNQIDAHTAINVLSILMHD